MKLLWTYVIKYRKILLGTLVLATINQVFSLLDPQIFRLIIDNYASKVGQIAQNEFITGILLLLLASIAVSLISRIAKNFQDYFVNVIVQKVGTQMYSDSVSHSFSLPYAIFEDQRSGEFLNKLEKARTDSEKIIYSSISIMFLSLVSISFVLVYAYVVHWIIGLFFSLLIPVMGVVTFFITRKIKAAQVPIIKESAELAGSTTETLRNVELVKSLGLEKQEIDRLNTVNQKILSLELKKVRLVRTLSFIQGTMVNALRSTLLLIMLWLIFSGRMSLGEFFSLLFYSFFIFNPLAELGNVSTQFQEAKASMERLEEILKIQPEEKPEHPQAIDKLESITFVDVGFRYQSGISPAVTNIDVEVNPGETVALVGPSGSGKTTLIKLLVGLYKPTEGSILFNSTNANEVDFEQIRKKIGFVSQETQLFAGTIRENLLFVNPGASDEDCIEALNAAAAVSLLNRGNAGLETKIGEGGLKLSGGEKQRLAIARALLRKPQLIIFDEATSSLDSITEEQITKTIQNIEKQYPNLMVVLVAHRLSTVAHANRIYVLEKGKIIETGAHDELLAKRGLYFALWRQQIAVKEKV